MINYQNVKRLSTFIKRRLAPCMAAVLLAAALCPTAGAQERSGFYVRDVTLKVNCLSLPLLVANAAVEVQPLDHWSASLPAYYTALDWFSETIKFRVLGFQPELRYWTGKEMNGLFFNAHATFAYYNVAWGGDYRYQDHARKTPAFGGGVGVGYKIPLDEDKTPWGIEFGIGGGVLPLHYDYYYNIRGGRLAGEDSHTYFGVDQAFVSFTYRIGGNKKTVK